MRAVGQIEDILCDSFVKTVESRDNGLDLVADSRVIVHPFLPGKVASVLEHGLSESSDNSRLTQQMFGSRCKPSTRRIDDSHAIFDGNKLWAALLFIDL